MVGYTNFFRVSLTVLLLVISRSSGFIASHGPTALKIYSSSLRLSKEKDDPEDEAARLRRQAEEIREQIRRMEKQLGDDRPRQYGIPHGQSTQGQSQEEVEGMTLNKKRVLVVGANGRLGSMVCRYLLRNHPQCEVVACVHYVGENSPTARGYARLSYEVGAEDGVGSIGAAWSSEDRTATFEFSDEMKDYNLQNLRLVECELLDPVQCNTITEGVDSVIWCATDFNGNQPRSISGLNVAFLFRAVTNPTKGRVEVEGLTNILGGLKLAKQARKLRESNIPACQNSPISFVLISAAPDALEDFETPFGSFHGIKRQGEKILIEDFPSLSYTILQMSRYDDNFVEENLDINKEDVTEFGDNGERWRRRINRRDAARAAVDALTDESLVGKTFQIWSDIRQ